MSRLGSILLVLALTSTAGIVAANRIDVPDLGGRRPDHVVVDKSERTLRLYEGERLLASFPIALGPEPVGPKSREGDGRTPEGSYTIDEHRSASRFHRALHVSYPTPSQIEGARARGEDPGGAIMIHGLRNGLGLLGRAHRMVDWTAGCIALTNPEMDLVYEAVEDGTSIEIRP